MNTVQPRGRGRPRKYQYKPSAVNIKETNSSISPQPLSLPIPLPSNLEIESHSTQISKHVIVRNEVSCSDTEYSSISTTQKKLKTPLVINPPLTTVSSLKIHSNCRVLLTKLSYEDSLKYTQSTTLSNSVKKCCPESATPAISKKTLSSKTTNSLNSESTKNASSNTTAVHKGKICSFLNSFQMAVDNGAQSLSDPISNPCNNVDANVEERLCIDINPENDGEQVIKENTTQVYEINCGQEIKKSKQVKNLFPSPVLLSVKNPDLPFQPKTNPIELAANSQTSSVIEKTWGKFPPGWKNPPFYLKNRRKRFSNHKLVKSQLENATLIAKIKSFNGATLNAQSRIKELQKNQTASNKAKPKTIIRMENLKRAHTPGKVKSTSVILERIDEEVPTSAALSNSDLQPSLSTKLHERIEQPSKHKSLDSLNLRQFVLLRKGKTLPIASKPNNLVVPPSSSTSKSILDCNLANNKPPKMANVEIIFEDLWNTPRKQINGGSNTHAKKHPIHKSILMKSSEKNLDYGAETLKAPSKLTLPVSAKQISAMLNLPFVERISTKIGQVLQSSGCSGEKQGTIRNMPTTYHSKEKSTERVVKVSARFMRVKDSATQTEEILLSKPCPLLAKSSKHQPSSTEESTPIGPCSSSANKETCLSDAQKVDTTEKNTSSLSLADCSKELTNNSISILPSGPEKSYIAPQNITKKAVPCAIFVSEEISNPEDIVNFNKMPSDAPASYCIKRSVENPSLSSLTISKKMRLEKCQSELEKEAGNSKRVENLYLESIGLNNKTTPLNYCPSPIGTIRPLVKRKLVSQSVMCAESNISEKNVNTATQEQSEVVIAPDSTTKPISTPVPVDKNKLKRLKFDFDHCLVPNEEGNIPLHLAVLQSNAALVKYYCMILTACKTSLDVLNNHKFSPLHLAMQHSNNKILVDWLLEYGADVDLVDGQGNTALHLAIHHHNFDVISDIIKHTQKINALNESGYSPLHIAVMQDQLTAVSKLLNAPDIDVCLQDAKSGRTALLHAMESNHIEIANYLVKNGGYQIVSNFSGQCLTSLPSKNVNTQTKARRPRLKPKISQTHTDNIVVPDLITSYDSPENNSKNNSKLSEKPMTMDDPTQL